MITGAAEEEPASDLVPPGGVSEARGARAKGIRTKLLKSCDSNSGNSGFAARRVRIGNDVRHQWNSPANEAAIWVHDTFHTRNRRPSAQKRATTGKALPRMFGGLLQFSGLLCRSPAMTRTAAPTAADTADATSTARRTADIIFSSSKASVPMNRLIVKPMPVKIAVP